MSIIIYTNKNTTWNSSSCSSVHRREMWNFTTMASALNPRTKTFNAHLNNTQNTLEITRDLKTLYLAVIMLMNILGNSGVIATVVREYELRSSPRNIVLTSLALSDIFMAVVIGFRIWLFYYEYTAPTSCAVFTTMFNIFLYVSFLHLLTLSIDSYVYVFYPLSYRIIITVKRFAIVIIAVWVLPATAMAALSVFWKGFNKSHVKSIFTSCVELQDITVVDKSYELFVYTIVSVFFITPMVCMIFVYLKIAKVSWYHSNRVGPLERVSAVHAGRFHAREMKWAKTIGIVIGTFMICYLPITVMLLCQASNGTKSSLSFAIQLVAFTNTAINPLVYSLRSREYRKALLKLVKSTKSSALIRALPLINQSTSSFSTRRKSSSLWIESSADMRRTSNAFTIYTTIDKTGTLESILSDVIKSAYCKEGAEEPPHCIGGDPDVAENSLSVPDVFSPYESRDCFSSVQEPNVRIV